jgi:hypothetical protein
VFARYDVQDVYTYDPDRQLLDPALFDFPPSEGDVAAPATFGHPNYFSDPLYAASPRALESFKKGTGRSLRQRYSPQSVFIDQLRHPRWVWGRRCEVIRAWTGRRTRTARRSSRQRR